MVVVKPMTSTSSTNTIHYVRGTSGSKKGDRAVYEWSQHTRPDSAINDFRRLRREYGQQGATRITQGKYVVPEDPAEATHIKVGGRYREAKANEVARYQRLVGGPDRLKSTEALHIVHSFGHHEVNIDDPMQTYQAFESVKAHYKETYPGAQLYMGAHIDSTGSKAARARGEKGKFHVHVIMNAVIYKEMTVDIYDTRAEDRANDPPIGERTYKRGHRAAGPLRNNTQMRIRSDRFINARGHEFGLPEQKLADPRSPEARAVRKRNHEQPARERGEVTPQERVRTTIEETYADMSKTPQAVAPLNQEDRAKLFASEVEKRGVATVHFRKNGTLGSYKPVKGASIRGQRLGGSLGDRYTDKGVQEQLEDIAQGKWKPLPEPERLPPRPVEPLTYEELEALVEEINNSPMVLEYERTIQEAESARLEAEQERELQLKRERDRKKIEAEINAKHDAMLQRSLINMDALRKREDDHAASIKAQIEADESELEAGIEARRAEQKRSREQRAEQRILAQNKQDVVEPQAKAERPSFLTPVEDFVSPSPARRESPVTKKTEPVRRTKRTEERVETPAPPVAPPAQPMTQTPAETPAPAPKKPTPVKRTQILGFSDEGNKGVDLIAIVNKEPEESKDNVATVTFEVAYKADQARGQSGLSLLVKPRPIDKNGERRIIDERRLRISAQQYERMKEAAGDQVAVVRGMKVYSFAADVIGDASRGYQPDMKTVQPSKSRPELDDRLFVHQLQAELAVKKDLAEGRTKDLSSEERKRHAQRQMLKRGESPFGGIGDTQGQGSQELGY